MPAGSLQATVDALLTPAVRDLFAQTIGQVTKATVSSLIESQGGLGRVHALEGTVGSAQQLADESGRK